MLLSPVSVAQVVNVQALFNNKAVVTIDGKRHMLAVGKPGPGGVVLVSANSRSAVLEIDGVRSTFVLDNQISTNFKPAEKITEQIWPNATGMYTTVGSINGLPVSFLVDTGATYIAMNSQQAKRLGIEYRLTGTPSWVITASGREQAFNVKLDRVTVGSIQLYNVDAAVLEGAQPEIALLGMSFLGRLKMENEGKALMLMQQR
jgi:aspartyl protease family protein